MKRILGTLAVFTFALLSVGDACAVVYIPGCADQTWNMTCMTRVYLNIQPDAQLIIDGVLVTKDSIDQSLEETDEPPVDPPPPPQPQQSPLPPQGNELPKTCTAPKDEKTPNPGSGAPVVLATGEKYLPERDFANKSIQTLALDRTYRANATNGLLFGPHWISPFDFPTADYDLASCYAIFLGNCMPHFFSIRLPDGSVQDYQWASTTISGDNLGVYYFPVGAFDGVGPAGNVKG